MASGKRATGRESSPSTGAIRATIGPEATTAKVRGAASPNSSRRAASHGVRWRSERTAEDSTSSTPMPTPATVTIPMATSHGGTAVVDRERPTACDRRGRAAGQPGRDRDADQAGRDVLQPDGRPRARRRTTAATSRPAGHDEHDEPRR